MTTTQQCTMTGHARERARQYGYDPDELTRLCGEHIGVQHGRANSPDPKDVWLAHTRTGRPVGYVTTRAPGPQIITLWDPSDPDNARYWQPDHRAPTMVGAMAMPATRWLHAT